MNAAPARRLDDRPVFLRALGRMLDDTELFGPEGPCSVLFEPGREGTRLLLVTGENASGKSLVCRYIGAFVKRFEDPDNPVEAYARNLPEKAIGLIVVTHSRMIAARIRKLGAHCLRVGDDLRPTHVWLEKGPLRRSIADLQRLKNRSLKRFRVVTRILDARRARSTSA